MTELLVATRNLNKIYELNQILSPKSFELFSLNDLNIDFTVEETGNTFEQNAILKAEQYCKKSQLLTIADDSVLEVELLDIYLPVEYYYLYKHSLKKILVFFLL